MFVSDAQKRATAKYNQTHYKNINVRLKINDAMFVKHFAAEKSISIAQLILKSIKYIYENNIDI